MTSRSNPHCLNNLPYNMAPPVVVFLLLLCVIYMVHVPLTADLWKEGRLLLERYALIKRADTFPSQIAEIQGQAKILDSLVWGWSGREVAAGTNIASLLYALADSSSIKTAKIEMGSPVRVGDADEVPVMIKGNGPYSSIGRFVASIENTDIPTRVRQLVLKNGGDGTADMHLEFVVVTPGN